MFLCLRLMPWEQTHTVGPSVAGVQPLSPVRPSAAPLTAAHRPPCSSLSPGVPGTTCFYPFHLGQQIFTFRLGQMGLLNGQQRVLDPFLKIPQPSLLLSVSEKRNGGCWVCFGGWGWGVKSKDASPK